MRVPVSNSSPNPKLNQSSQNITFQTPTSTNITNHNNNILNLCYEPTSVLDLRRSPSPVATDKPVSATVTDDHHHHHHHRHRNHHPAVDQWDEQTLHNLDWDSIMGDLGLHEDSNSSLKNNNNNSSDPNQVHHFPDLLQDQEHDQDPNQLISPDFFLSEDQFNSSNHNLFHNFPANNYNNVVGFEFIEDMIRAADFFDTNELQLAHVILERLNQRLHYSSTGKPLQRAAFFFKEALQSLLSGSTRSNRLSSWPEIVQTIRAHKAFSSISPIPMFSHFTTNQALLEALNNSSFIHIVDFDIGFGGQYASLMKEISEKAESRKTISPVLRITAVVPEEFAVENRLIKENLSQFAHDLKIRFHIDLVPLRSFETMSFKSVKFMDGEKSAILLTPAIFRRLGSINSIGSFLGDIKRISPCVVVFVDGEGWMDSGTASFKRNLVDGLEFYSMMMESLDAAVAGGDWVRRIENFVLRPKILTAVEGAGRMAPPPWREVFHGAGMRPVGLSQFADSQAECLLDKVQVRGFQVGKRHAELVLCWHERPLVATSAWRC